jgi:hypothetical protein
MAAGHGRHMGHMRPIPMVAMVASMSRVLNRRRYERRTSPRDPSTAVNAFAFRFSAATFFHHVPDHGGDVGPPNSATCLMPVGEVTLISVR